MPGATRDPVSELFDGSARRLLSKAYARPGTWQEIWLPDPSIRQRTRFVGVVQGDLLGPDPLPKGGGVDAKTRWARGFVRSLYYQHKNFSPARGGEWRTERRASPNTRGLRVEVGRHVPASPQFNPADPGAGGFPPRRKVRIQLAAGGRAKDAALARLSNKDRIYTPAGDTAARWAGGGKYRDWA